MPWVRLYSTFEFQVTTPIRSCHLSCGRLFFPFQFFADRDQRVPGAFVDAFIEGRDVFEQRTKRDERLPGLAGEQAPGGSINLGGV